MTAYLMPILLLSMMMAALTIRRDAEGFIKLNALRLRIAANRGRDLK